jgi:hypothetical protein
MGRKGSHFLDNWHLSADRFSRVLEQAGARFSMKLQRFELNKYYDHPIFCIFCGQKVIDFDKTETPVTPCPHTVYVAHDEGWEYLSKIGEQVLVTFGFSVGRDDGLIELGHDDENVECHDIEGITDRILFEDGLKVASYVGAPSGMGTYVGLAPVL